MTQLEIQNHIPIIISKLNFAKTRIDECIGICGTASEHNSQAALSQAAVDEMDALGAYGDEVAGQFNQLGENLQNEL